MHIHFVTGKLAEPALRRVLAEVATCKLAAFEYSISVLPITVAALATTPWIARHLAISAGIDRVLLPGLCVGDLAVVAEVAGVPVARGPADLRDLPEFFGGHGQDDGPQGVAGGPSGVGNLLRMPALDAAAAAQPATVAIPGDRKHGKPRISVPCGGCFRGASSRCIYILRPRSRGERDFRKKDLT